MRQGWFITLSHCLLSRREAADGWKAGNAVSILLHTLWDTGVRLVCPVCEQGRLFKEWFTMQSVCPHCHVRFERYEGEVVGGVTISTVVTCAVFLIGYATVELRTEWPVWIHLAIWVPFAALFPIVFYRHSRAFWVAFLYLVGDVNWDREPYEEPSLSIIDAFLHTEQDASLPKPPTVSPPDDTTPPHERSIP